MLTKPLTSSALLDIPVISSILSLKFPFFEGNPSSSLLQYHDMQFLRITRTCMTST